MNQIFLSMFIHSGCQLCLENKNPVQCKKPE